MNEFKEGESEFTFPNQDKYVGHFGAHISGLAWRQGPGIYYTHEGQTYEGFWKDDRLDESRNVNITFENNDKYEGKISKYKYNGPGTYQFKNNSRLSCIFQNNKPVGNVIFIDNHDKLWYGLADQERVLLNREHVFSYELDSERGKGAPLKPPPIEETLAVEPEETYEEIDQKKLEQIIFKKSCKTSSEISFQESDWLKDYQKYNDLYQKIKVKVKRSGPRHLEDEEKEFYKKYKLLSSQILENHKKGNFKKIDYNVMKDYLMEKSKETCPPTTVFYPTQIGEQEEQQVEQ